MKVVEKIAFIITLVGSMNYLLVGVFNFNFLDFIFHNQFLIKLIYIIIGISSFISIKKIKG